MNENESGTPTPKGVIYARLFGIALGGYLLISTPVKLATAIGGPSPGLIAKSLFLLLFGLFQFAPWKKIHSRKAWKRIFALFALASVAFVFVIMFETLFNYIDMMSVGRKPGLPAFNGTLIFIALLQVPTVLFQRRPELLE